MSSAKRRKIDEGSSSRPVKTKKVSQTVPSTTSAFLEPAAQPSQTTASNAEPEKDAPVQKTFRDLVSYSLCSNYISNLRRASLIHYATPVQL